MKTRNKGMAVLGALATTAAVVTSTITPAAAEPGPQGYHEEDFGVGYSYGTFDQDPNLLLLVGGDAEAFCLDAPDDPFGYGEPGQAMARVFVRQNGQVDVKVNDKDQPIHVYEADAPPPVWLPEVCDALFDGDPSTTVPAPFASGTADLKVRISIVSDDLVDVFNSVNGKAMSSDGTRYKIRASADLVVENGVPVGDPADFVELDVKRTGR